MFTCFNLPADIIPGIIYAKRRNEPPAHLRKAVEAARANAAAVARERIPDPRGPYHPILGFQGCFPDQSFGPRERNSFQRAAQHNGWLVIFAWFDAHPDRNYYVRPALQGENPARANFECAQPDNGLQWRWTIGRNANGPVILAMERRP